MVMIVPMGYTQLPNHFPKGFWCPGDQKWWYMDPYVCKVRIIIVVLRQVICIIVCGCDYRPPLFVKFIKINI